MGNKCRQFTAFRYVKAENYLHFESLLAAERGDTNAARELTRDGR